MLLQTHLSAQNRTLNPGDSIEKKLLKGETHIYQFDLKKGEYAACVLYQKGVDLAIELINPSGKKINSFDSPNGKFGPEPVAIEATQTGMYELRVYALTEQSNLADSMRAAWIEENQGEYKLNSVKILSVNAYKLQRGKAKENDAAFLQWIKNNSYMINTVDAGNDFGDLRVFGAAFKGARVVGLGEATHGTSEFFRMKHRLLEYLVKEMGFNSFYIEASMTRCRYVNDYVLYGKGNLDTATVIQGFTTWRVEEVRNMIEWLRVYNTTVSPDRRLKFLGYDLQINDRGWAHLKEFYKKVQPLKLAQLDSLQARADTASSWSNSDSRQKAGADLFKTVYKQCLDIMNDAVLNQGEYEYIAGKESYEENLLNMKLIIQEIESYKDGYNNQRDYYMAQNILELLNKEKTGAKVVVWAHNGHIAKQQGTMGYYLDKVLKQNYYALGFEFYSGSFQSRSLDIVNNTPDWDIISIGDPPVKSLPWYFNATGKDKLFIDFKNTGADSLTNFSKLYNAHSFGSMYSKNWSQSYPLSLKIYDGMIFIKTSTAAKNFTKVRFR